MSFDLGEMVPLRIIITNTAGVPENAGSVSLTITLPDGTTHIEASVPGSAGVYDFDYPSVQAGVHRVRWVATGINAGAFTDVIDVEPAEGAPFVSLADQKHHLKKTNADDDEKLRGFIAAACSVIEDRMGHVTPVALTTDGHGCTVILDRPAISVTSVVQMPGGTTVPAADELAGTDGWTLHAGAGVLKLSRSYGRLRVTYRAGRSPLPGNFRLAALELAAHLWRTSQHNTSGGRPSLGVDETVVPGVSYALPYNVRQLLGLDKRPQEEVLVG
ncbi:hypothetical protein [Nonomuraea sp. NPDC002799]